MRSPATAGRARARARRDQVERAAAGRLPGRPAAGAAREPRRRAAVLHRLEGAQHRAARSRHRSAVSSSTNTACSESTRTSRVAGATEEDIYGRSAWRSSRPSCARIAAKSRRREPAPCPHSDRVAGSARRSAHAHDGDRRPRRRRDDGARGARRRASYIAITDHSQALAMANGLDERARSNTRAGSAS